MENSKKTLLYVAIGCLAIVVAILIGTNSLNDRNKRAEKAAQTQTVSEEDAKMMLEKINSLQKENLKMKKKLEGIEEKEKEYTSAAEAINEMKDIHALYKASRVTEAVEAFKKIDTEEFDEVETAYYRLLRDYINK